jgi:hypothetical protein
MGQGVTIDLRYPNEDSDPQGRYIEDNGDQFFVFSWWHWNGTDFGGVLSTWVVTDWGIDLHQVYLKDKGRMWKLLQDENLGQWVPDRHKRIARELGRDKFKLTQFYRLRL